MEEICFILVLTPAMGGRHRKGRAHRLRRALVRDFTRRSRAGQRDVAWGPALPCHAPRAGGRGCVRRPGGARGGGGAGGGGCAPPPPPPPPPPPARGSREPYRP